MFATSLATLLFVVLSYINIYKVWWVLLIQVVLHILFLIHFIYKLCYIPVKRSFLIREYIFSFYFPIQLASILSFFIYFVIFRHLKFEFNSFWDHFILSLDLLRIFTIYNYQKFISSDIKRKIFSICIIVNNLVFMSFAGKAQ